MRLISLFFTIIINFGLSSNAFLFKSLRGGFVENKRVPFIYIIFIFEMFFLSDSLNAQSENIFSIHGITEPYCQATISAEFASKIVHIYRDEGYTVKKNDTIIALDYEQAQLEAERTKIIAESKAELFAAENRLKIAKLDFDATRLVFDSTRAISEEDLWKKELEYNLAKAEFDKLTAAKAKEVVEHKIALRNLAHHFILAPYDCVVATRFLNLAETCKPQESLVRIADINRCRFIAYVPSSHTKNLQKGTKVNLVLNSANGELPREGTVDFISPVVDPSCGLRTVKILFDNQDRAIQPGITGQFKIEQ
ncbi:MAG: efflux RND transporter periplasmic adaptor subunit [Chitinispirillaceae bacterium]|nr:efflux RND transporter periplasmic adaptor subunit [Chitinispirillaceae bacterium]